MMDLKTMIKSLIVVLGIGVNAMHAATHNNQVEITPELLQKSIQVCYTNYRGETAVRTIVPLEVYFGKTEYHPQEQWLLRVWDVEKAAERIYAFKEIKEILG